MAKDVGEDVEIIPNKIPQQSDKSERTFVIKRTTAIILMITVLIILLILIINFATMIFLTAAGTSTSNTDEVKVIKLENSSRTENSHFLENNNRILHVISRDEWIAVPPYEESTDLVLPVNTIIIAHTATENCTNQAACTFRVRFLQTFHMESRGWDDIGYNFLVGGDGSVYVGRGWNKMGAHTKGKNAGSICIAFIGTFTKYEPPERQLNSARLLIQEGIKLKKVAVDYKLYGHRQFIPSESPGSALYRIIQSWEHWTNIPEVI